MMVPRKRDQIHFFLSLTEGLAFGILPPADFIASVQPTCVGIHPQVGNKSNFHYSLYLKDFKFRKVLPFDAV